MVVGWDVCLRNLVLTPGLLCSACVVSFDISLMEALQGSQHQHGIYNTTCVATVEIGFGEACDDYLKRGGIDCSAQSQNTVFSTAKGQIQFSLPSSSGASKTYFAMLSLLIGAGTSILLMQ